MLEVNGLSVDIGPVSILRDVSLSVPTGRMVGLIGRNGAGKTTLLRSVMGLIQPKSGAIHIDGADFTKTPGHTRARTRVGFMPEARNLVPDLLVEENVRVPGWASDLEDLEDRLAWVYGLMPEVAGFAQRRALSLSGGQQKLVALARALLIGKKLLLLDEPFEGVAPALSRRLVDVIDTLKGEGLSVLIAESDSAHTTGLVDDTYVIERGAVNKR